MAERLLLAMVAHPKAYNEYAAVASNNCSGTTESHKIWFN